MNKNPTGDDDGVVGLVNNHLANLLQHKSLPHKEQQHEQK